MVEGGPEDLDSNGIVDPDWYDDNVPGGGPYAIQHDKVQAFYMDLFGARVNPMGKISDATVMKDDGQGTIYTLPDTDAMGEAVSSGWDLRNYDPYYGQDEFLSGHQMVGKKVLTALDVITTLAAIAYGGTGLVHEGKAAYGAVKSAGGVKAVLSKAKYLGRGIEAASKGKAVVQEAIPEWMKVSQYVSARVGQPIQYVITNAANSENTALRLTGRAASAMTRTPVRVGATTALAAVFGRYAASEVIKIEDRSGYESGQDQIEAERKERDRQLGVTARWNSEESVLKRETQRREEARETYGGVEPEVAG
jgi:hypothetical protein